MGAGGLGDGGGEMKGWGVAGGWGWRDGCCLLYQRTRFLSPAPHSPSPLTSVPRTLMPPSKGTEHTHTSFVFFKA